MLRGSGLRALIIAMMCVASNAFIPHSGFLRSGQGSHFRSSVSQRGPSAVSFGKTMDPSTRFRSSFRRATSSIRCSAETEKFASWLKENGVKGEFTLADAKNGRGFVTKSAVKAGEQACFVPVKVMMTQQTAHTALGSKTSELDAETAIALQLILEQSKGDSSFYAPWIKMFPQRDSLDTPLFWSEEEMSELVGSQVYEDTKELKESLLEELQQLKADDWDSVLKGSLTVEAYEWATSIVSSRAFKFEKFPGETALAPAVDFLEHSTQGGAGKVEFTFDGMFREPCIKFTMPKGAQAGATVAANYERSNNRNVFKRGLADIEAVHGTYDLKFSISDLDRFRDDKEDILEQEGYTKEQTFTLTSDDDPPMELVTFLRLLCTAKQDAFLLEAVFRRDVWGFMQLPVSRDNEKQVFDTLIGNCEDALDAYETTERADAGTQMDEEAPLRSRLAAAAKLGERKALKRALRVFYEELELLDDKDYYQERRLKDLNLDRPLDESEIIDPNVPIRPDAVEF